MNMKFKIYWHYVVAGIFGLISLILLVVPFFNRNQGPLTWADVGTVAAVSAALAAILVTLGDRGRDKDYTRSLFYLEKSTDGFEKAFCKIKDGNNIRTSWIAAARILDRTMRVSKKITDQDHKDIFEIEMLFRRSMFLDLLDKPAPFFYGAKDTTISLDDAAAQSSAPEGRWISTVHAIPESAIATILNVASFPKDYVEEIDYDISDEDIRRLPFDGLVDYLEHRKEFRSAEGKLHRRKDMMAESDEW